MAWRNVHIGNEGDRVTVGGVPLWQHEWRWVGGKSVFLPDPLESGQTCSFMICEVGHVRRPVRFAAGKLPNALWAFYVSD